jgi:hypothetical protein
MKDQPGLSHLVIILLAMEHLTGSTTDPVVRDENIKIF